MLDLLNIIFKLVWTTFDSWLLITRKYDGGSLLSFETGFAEIGCSSQCIKSFTGVESSLLLSSLAWGILSRAGCVYHCRFSEPCKVIWQNPTSNAVVYHHLVFWLILRYTLSGEEEDRKCKHPQFRWINIMWRGKWLWRMKLLERGKDWANQYI